VAFNTILIIATILDDIAFSKGNRIGLFNDWGWWVISIIFTTMFFTFLWIPDGVTKTILGLKNNGVIILSSLGKGGDEEIALDEFLHNFFRSYANRYTYVLPAILTSLILISIIESQREFITWQTVNGFNFWFVMFLYTLFSFFGLLSFIRTIIAVVWFNRLFRDLDVEVKFLHPDNAGGFAPLSGFSVTIVYVIIITAIAHVLGDVSEAAIKSITYLDVVKQSYVLVDYLMYCAFATLAFFTPLYLAHTRMKKAKHEVIAIISDQFNAELAYIRSIQSSDRTKLKNSVSKLEDLQKLHTIAIKFPVWPFNIGYLARFFGAIVSPLIISFLSIVIEQLLW